jgi:hypothetical protein
MYTRFINLSINVRLDINLYLRCFPWYVRCSNCSPQRQCTAGNDVQQTGILLVSSVLEWWHRQFQFHVSGPAAFLVFQCSLCVLYVIPHVKVQDCLVRKSRWILHPSAKPCPPSRQINTRNISHVSVVTWWGIDLLTLTSLLQKETVYGRCSVVLQDCLSMQHLRQLLQRKRAVPVLCKTYRTTLTQLVD